MAISLNQFAPNEPLPGLYVYQANLPQIHNAIISETQSTPLTYGCVVKLDTASTNTNAPVVLQAGVKDPIFGVVTFTPVKAQFAAGERIAVARANDVIWMVAAGAITVGADLYFTSTNKVTGTATAGNSIIGRALTAAAGDGDYVQVELGFATTPESSGT